MVKNNQNKTQNDTNKQETGPIKKKVDIYKNALRRTLKSGTEDIDDDPVLRELRNNMNINNKLHQEYKQEIIDDLARIEKTLKESKLKIAKIEKKIGELKKKSMDTQVIEGLLERAEEAKDENAYVEFDAYIEECSKIANNLTRQFKTHQQIENVKKIYIKAEKMGANVKKVKQLIKKAETSLEKNNFTQAAKIATEVRKLSIKLRRFGTAQKQIQSFSQSLRNAKKNFEVKECEDLVKRAQIALKNIEYDKVSKNIAAAKKALSAAKSYHLAQEKVSKIEEMVLNAKETGIDLKKIALMVKELKKYLKQKEYNKLSKHVTKIRKEINEATKYKNANDRIIEAQEEINKAKKAGSSVKTAVRLLGQAKTALKKKKYSNVQKYARSSIKLAKESRATAIRRKASSAISSAKFLIKDVTDFGIDVTESGELLKRAEQAFNKKDYNLVEEIAREAEQLAKQKFEKKKKEYMGKGVKKTLSSVQFMLDESKELNIDTDETEGLYSKAQEQFNAGDFKTADKTIKEAEKIARGALEDARQKQKVEKAEKGLNDAKKIFDEVKQLGVDVSAMEPLLEEAEDMFEKEEFDGVLEKTSDLTKTLSVTKNKLFKTHSEALIKSTNAIIKEAKNVGVDLSEAESIMNEVKSKFDAKDYVKAEELVKQCQVVAKKSWTEFRTKKIRSSIENAQNSVDEAKNLGVDVKDAEDLIKKATSKIQANDFKDAENLINKAQIISDKKIKGQRISQAIGALDNLREVYDEIKSSGQPVGEFKKLMDDAEKKVKTNDFEMANEYINRANKISSEILLKERQKKYSVSIKKNKELVAKINESGIDTVELEKQLSDVEELYSKKDFQDFDGRIDQIENKAQDLLFERRKEISTKLLSQTIESVGKSREIGGDVQKAEKYLTDAEKIIGEDDFDIANAQELLTIATSEAEQSWTTRKTELVTDAVSSAQTLIKETKEMGADVSDAEKLLQDAEQMFKEDDFDFIDEKLNQVNEIIESTKIDQKSKIVNKAVTSTKVLLAETREMGVDVDEAEDILKQAENMFEDQDYDAVDLFIKKAENALKNSQMEFKRDETSKMVSSTKAKIDEGREKGADVADAEELLLQAENMMLTEADFTAVEDLIKMSQSSLASSWGQYKSQRMIDDISQMHGRIVQLRSYGLDLSKAEKILQQAEIEYKSEKMDNVEEMLIEASQIIDKEYAEQFISKITLLINDVKSLVKQAKDNDLDIVVGEDMLGLAITQFEAKDYPKAEELAKKAKDIITEIIESSEKGEIQNYLEKVKSLISDAKTLGIDASPAERLFRQAMALFNTKEYETCREFTLKSENVLNSLAKRHIQNIHPHLTVDVIARGVMTNKWNKISLQISNDSKIQAQDVEFGIKGNFEIKGKKKIPAINSNDTFKLELGFMTAKVGEIPMKIMIKCYRPFDRNEYKFTDRITIKTQEVGKFSVQDVFVIYIDGCLITHKTKEFREMVDEDIFSGMLVAVQNFISDSFRQIKEEGLNRLDFGKNKILIERGPRFFMATVVEGEEPGSLLLYLIETVKAIQDKFGSVLDDWDGNIEHMAGIDEIVNNLLNLTVVEDTDELQPITESPSTIISVKSMISEAKELGVDTTVAEKELQKAETMVESSDYSSVWNQIQRVDDLVRSSKREYYFDDVKSTIATVKDGISEVKDIGGDVEEAEICFSQMKELVQDEKFTEVLEHAESCKRIVVEAKEKKVTQNCIQKLDTNLEIANEWGIDTSGVQTKREQLNTAVDEKDFKKARKLIKKVNKTLKEALAPNSLDSIAVFSDLNKNIEEVKDFGIDTEESSNFYASAKEAIDDLDLKQVNESIKQINNKLSIDKNHYFEGKATETLTAAKNSMGELQKMNINIDEALGLVTEAENNVNNKNYIVAFDTAVKIQQLLDAASHIHQSKAILDTITSAEGLVANAKEHGLDLKTIQPIEEMIVQGKTALDSRDYKTAGDLAIKANTTAKESFTRMTAEQEQLKAQMDTTMSAITTTKEIGVDTTEVESLVQRMKKVLDEGDIEATKGYMENIQKTLDQLQIPYKAQVYTREIKKLDKYLNETKEKGLDVQEPEHLIENAKNILETEEFESIDEYLNKARKMLDDLSESHRAIVISEAIQSTYKMANEVQAMGAEVSFAFNLLKQAGTMLTNMELDNAEEFTTNALNSTEEIKKQFLSKEATEQILKSEEEILKAKESGLKTVDAERLLAQAKKYFEAEELENSKQYAINTQQLIVDIVEKQKVTKAKDLSTYVTRLYEEVKNMGANVVQADAPLMQAKASMNNKDYDMALTYFDNVKRTLDQLKRPFLIKLAQDAVKRGNNAVTDALNYGADVTEATKILYEAQNALANRDFNNAEEKAKKAERIAMDEQQKYFAKYISNEIRNVKENIKKLKPEGYDMTLAEGMLDKINTIYLNKNFQELGGKLKALHEHLIILEQERYIEHATDAISFSKSMIKYVKNNIKDISSKIKNAEKLMKRADFDFKNKVYSRAEETATQAQHFVENLKHSKLEQFLFVFKQLQAEEMLSQAKSVIGNVKKLEIDVTESEELVKMAEEAFKDDATYHQGQDYLTNAKILAHEQENKIQEKNAINAISTAESLIITLKGQGMNVESANKLLDQAKSALEIRGFKKSILFAGKAKFTAKKLQDTTG